ncbi:MAG: aspartate aminotransferase family protein, partial [Chloroflexi bacterium]|nr:aspartate aminotransferase family protein [Chloroflexota bacterium]
IIAHLCKRSIAEPITGSSRIGQIPPEDYFRRIREICDRYDILLIADEVQTAFGRTGKRFAIDHWSVTPDIITFAKGASGGYCPLGGMIVSQKVIDVLMEKFSGRFHHGHTFSANPFAAAVGNAVLDVIEREDLVTAAREQGKYLKGQLVDLAEGHPSIGDVRGYGLQIGVEFVKDRRGKTPFAPETQFARRLSKLLLDRHVIVSASGGPMEGGGGDEMRITPSMAMTRGEIDELNGAMDAALTELEQTRLN